MATRDELVVSGSDMPAAVVWSGVAFWMSLRR
jgi:hypothetical protein